MGRSITPKYRIEIVETLWTDTTKRYKSAIRWKGQATEKRLIDWIKSYETSTSPNGVNSHLGIREILEAKIIEQKTGKITQVYKK